MSQLGTKKSRRGCVRCKQRRVKCDEQAPCGNCVRRSEECSLLEPSPSGSEMSLEPGLPTNPQEWTQDLELMHHFSRIPMFSLGTREDTSVWGVWTDYIPQQAVRHPWLMHGILAAAALHLAYTNRYRSGHYLQLSDKHQAVALKTYRSVLAGDINADNADALFGLASILSVSTMARARDEAHSAEIPGAMNMDSVTEFFYLTRGIRDVIRLTHDFIHQGPMTVLFDRQMKPEGVSVTLPPSVLQQFAAIHQMLHTFGIDPEALTHCEQALSDLQDIYESIAYFAPNTIIETGTVWRWPIHVSAGFVRLVQASFQPALVIFAHFAAAVSAVRTTWFNQFWGEYAVNGVATALDETMLHWVDWPRQETKSRMAILGVKMPPEPTTNDLPLHG